MAYSVRSPCFVAPSDDIDYFNSETRKLCLSLYRHADQIKKDKIAERVDLVKNKIYESLALKFPETMSMDNVAHHVSGLFLSGKMTIRDAEHLAHKCLSIQEQGLHLGCTRRLWKVANEVFICMTKNKDPRLGIGSVKKAKTAIAVCSPKRHVILTTSIEDEEERLLFLREVGAWNACARFGATMPLIASTITETSKGETRGYMLTERADRDFFKFLKKNRGTLPIEQCLHIAYQITRKVSLLHENGWIHGDLKPSNMLVLDDTFYLSDFGFSKQVTENMPFGGTKCYQSPENINRLHTRDRPTNTLASDAWALGCILYEIYHPQCMRLIADGDHLLTITQEDLSYHIPSSLRKAPQEIVSIIQGLLMIDPKRRLTVPAARDALHALIQKPEP